MESKPKSIEFAEFKEELLPSGRKLLHLVFKEKFGSFRYVWIPPWKGETGVEKVFFKALEIEEWNDYEGAWSKELKKAAGEIPSLEDIKLPVKIRVGGVTYCSEVWCDELGEEEFYSVSVQVLSDEVGAWKYADNKKKFICIGDIKISWDSIKNILIKQDNIRDVSEGIETVSEWFDVGDDRCEKGEDIGVSFSVLLEAGLEKAKYQVIGREIAFNIRSFIRKCLSDYHALKKGFEEP